jgi:hypothetical protein
MERNKIRKEIPFSIADCRDHDNVQCIGIYTGKSLATRIGGSKFPFPEAAVVDLGFSTRRGQYLICGRVL